MHIRTVHPYIYILSVDTLRIRLKQERYLGYLVDVQNHLTRRRNISLYKRKLAALIRRY